MAESQGRGRGGRRNNFQRGNRPVGGISRGNNQDWSGMPEHFGQQNSMPLGYGYPGAPPPWAFQGPFFPQPPIPNQWMNQPPPWGAGPAIGPIGNQGFGGQNRGSFQQGGGVSSEGDQKANSGDGDRNQQGTRKAKNPPKVKATIQKDKEAATSPQAKADTYAEVICYSSGEPGHHRAGCGAPLSCFICKMVTHKVEDCLEKKKPRTPAVFIGSAASGLGFFQINIPDINLQHVGDVKNVGLVFVETGQITKEELATNFSEIYKTNWPWQIRKLDDWSFLVKFPPHIPVAQVARYPMFGLPANEGVTVNVEVWKGKLDAEAELQQVWVLLEGMDPKWTQWAILEQFASVFGTLIDVDWQHNFKNLAEVVRIKIRCKDYTKIPSDRLFGVGEGLYRIKVTVEPPELNFEDDDLLEEDLSKGKKAFNNSAPATGKDKSTGGNGAGQNSNTNNSASSGTGKSSNSNSKQAALDFLLQIQDSHVGECNLLQDMELLDEDSVFSEKEEPLESDGEGVIFSPGLVSNRETAPSHSLEINNNNFPQLQKWGPVVATRKSSRVDIGDRAMLEIAMEKEKVSNLETGKNSIKGLVEDSVFLKKVADLVQRRNVEESRRVFCDNLRQNQVAALAESGVEDGAPGEKMEFSLPGDHPSMEAHYSMSPVAEREERKKTVLLSPVTPLEMANSPVQSPLKKSKMVAEVASSFQAMQAV